MSQLIAPMVLSDSAILHLHPMRPAVDPPG